MPLLQLLLIFYIALAMWCKPKTNHTFPIIDSLDLEATEKQLTLLHQAKILPGMSVC